MYLTKDEERMLSGKEGEGYRWAMETLVKHGEFYDAERMVPIDMAYLVGGGMESPNGYLRKWREKLMDTGVNFKTPLVIGDEQDRRMGALVGYGSGGSPMNQFILPVRGQYLTSGGSNCTAYFNAIIGAKTMSESSWVQYATALVGATPKYGYYVDENRVGKTLIDVKAELKDETDWATLGYYTGKILGQRYWDVPVFTGVNLHAVTNDDLISLCSCTPAYGACFHFLVEGISPEAHTREQAFGGEKPKETITVGNKELKTVYDTFSSTKEKPDLVELNAVSIRSIYRLANLLKGKKVTKDFPVIMSGMMGPSGQRGPVMAVAERMGLTKIIEASGVQLKNLATLLRKKGTQMDEITAIWYDGKVAAQMGINTIVIPGDAAPKHCHYASRWVEPVLLPMDKAVEVALTGKLVGRYD